MSAQECFSYNLLYMASSGFRLKLCMFPLMYLLFINLVSPCDLLCDLKNHG